MMSAAAVDHGQSQRAAIAMREEELDEQEKQLASNDNGVVQKSLDEHDGLLTNGRLNGDAAAEEASRTPPAPSRSISTSPPAPPSVPSEDAQRIGNGSMSSAAASRGTITCLLCGGVHVHPGPRFENHLLNEHGVVFGADFFIKVCLFKQRHGRLPRIEGEQGGPESVEDDGDKAKPEKAAATNGQVAMAPRRKSSNGASFSSAPSPLGLTVTSATSVADATDLHCYFGCDEAFKKDYQLFLHLKLRHQGEDQEELARAFEAAEEEIALTRRSGSVYECALCSKQFHDNGAFYGHIQTKHNMQWREYKDRFGRCEIESAPFECKICGRVIKYDRNTVHTHLKNVHGINWAVYVDRIRKLQRGEEPGELPQIEMTECKVCNVNVKYLKDHLRNAHKITEQEYESLFGEGASQQQQQESSLSQTPRQEGTSALKRSLMQGQSSQTQPRASPVDGNSSGVRNAPLPKPPKSDIQDKTNKKCSSCNITFDSRRSFIEHCTTVHNMKFKTKSGYTISAPTVMRQGVQQSQQQQQVAVVKPPPQQQQQQQQQQQLQKRVGNLSTPPPLVLGGVKRRAPDLQPGFRPRPPPPFLEPSPPPPQKVAKREQMQQQPSDVSFDEPADEDDGSNLHMAPQYSPAGVSKWNQCRYECCFCKKTTMSRSSMTSHIHNTHGIPIKEYKESNYPDIEVETHWFQCRLCSARTKFVKDCIAPHLKMSHNMDIETYEQQVMQPEDWPALSGSRPRSTMRDRGGEGAPEQRQFLEEQMDDEGSGGGDVDFDESAVVGKDDKWNKCRFRCCLCDWMCADSRQMRTHIASNHGITHEEYQREYGSTEVVTKRFHCRLCGSQMKHCRQNIYAHMKDVHKITLTDYEQQVDQEMGGGDDGHHLDDDEEEAVVAPIAVHPPPQSRPKTVPPSMSATTSALGHAKPGLLDNGNPPSRWNRCRFQCALCGKLSSEKRHVREHIIKLHQLSMQEYEDQYGDCEIHTEYFFCGICHSEVKHNLKNISLHLNNVHHMNAHDYEKQFGRMPDTEVVIGNKQPQPQRQNVNQGRRPQQQYQQQGWDGDSLDHAGEIDGGDYGFGAHFLLDEGNGEDSGDVVAVPPPPPVQRAPVGGKSRPPGPPREEVADPRNRYCSVCNHEFTRRYNFVEHCRNVHGMKIKLVGSSSNSTAQVQSAPRPAAGSPPAPAPQHGGFSSRPGRARLDCEFCGKVFSNRSNRNRHVILSCEMRKTALGGGAVGDEEYDQQNLDALDDDDEGEGDFPMDGDHVVVPAPTPVIQKATSIKTEMAEEPPRKAVREPIKCPYPECDETTMRSALMKRHLFDAHAIQQNVTVALPGLEEDGEKKQEGQSEEESTSMATPTEEAKKVPPLRVKLSDLKNSSSSNNGVGSVASVETPTVPPVKEAKPCQHCSVFKTSNMYILNRHENACQKRMLALRQSTEEAEAVNSTEDGTQESSSEQAATVEEQHPAPEAEEGDAEVEEASPEAIVLQQGDDVAEEEEEDEELELKLDLPDEALEPADSLGEEGQSEETFEVEMETMEEGKDAVYSAAETTVEDEMEVEDATQEGGEEESRGEAEEGDGQ